MNDWYELLHDLETDVQPLDEVTQTRIENRVRSALPRRRKRPQFVAVIAAVLILTACGYAAVTGQFSDWFWNVTDQENPKAAEDLLASMGTVIDQSQTVDGTTVTLHGAIWDGETLMLSATIESDTIPTDTWTNVESHDSILHASKESMIKSYLEYYPDADEAELAKNVDKILEMMKDHNRPKINYLRNRNTGAYYLQIEDGTIGSNGGSIELELHLENLKFHNSDTVIEGPFDFTFTVEQRYPEVIYEGTAVLEQENGVELHLSRVYMTPFRVEIDFDVPGTMTEEEFHEHWAETNITGLHMGEETTSYVSTGNSILCKREDHGSVSGTISRGPFHEAIDPASVTAIQLEEFLLDLNSFTLSPNFEE